METVLEDMELLLTDLLQSGLATAGPEMGKRAQALADRAQTTGMHTGAALLTEIARGLGERRHQMEKSDSPLVGVLCRTSYYVELCRQRRTEEVIRRRWQEGEQL